VRLRSIAGAALAGLAVAALLGSAALVFATLAGAALAALVVVSRRRVFESFSFERTPAQRVIAWGGRLDVTMSFSNAKLLPLVWMRVRDEWPLGLEPRGFALKASAVHANQSLSQTISLRWYERVRRHYQVRCLQRGLHRFGPVELEAGDPFGIAGVVRTLPAREEIVVLPRVLDVPGLELLTGRPLVDEPALRSLTTDPTALRGTRPYLTGDALRAVNWRATARTGTLHANEFDPTTLTAVRLLLDVSVFEHAWLGVDPTRMELLCVVAASLAAAFAGRGFGVGLASNARLTGDWRAVDVEPREGALDEVLVTLGRVLVFPPDDFGRVLNAELADDTAEADCVLVAAALRAPVRELLERLRAERRVTVVYVGSPSSEERPFVDAIVPGDFDWKMGDALPLVV
jgi:uncharacterized protein (DUF58 family)